MLSGTEGMGRQNDVHNLIAIAYSDRDVAEPHCLTVENILICSSYTLGASPSSPCPCPNPERHAPHRILPGPRVMRALVVGCLPFLHLAQVRSQGDLRHGTVDIYLIERVFTRRTTELL